MINKILAPGPVDDQRNSSGSRSVKNQESLSGVPTGGSGLQVAVNQIFPPCFGNHSQIGEAPYVTRRNAMLIETLLIVGNIAIGLFQTADQSSQNNFFFPYSHDPDILNPSIA